MAKLLFAVAAAAAAAAATAAESPAAVAVESFSKPSHKWVQKNDPVMGGKSTGTFSISNGLGVFDGEVVNVPFLKAPGFIKVSTTDSVSFPDVSLCKSLSIKAKSKIAYKGFRVSFGDAKAPGGKFFAYGYKAPFEMPADDEFHTVVLPFTNFSDAWDDATGDIITSCAKDSRMCPSKDSLQNLKTISIWGEGVAGKVHLEIESISASGCSAAPQKELIGAPKCPPANFSSDPNFDLDKYISKRWHVQEMMAISYLPKDYFYCVTTKYTKKTKRSLLGYDVDVHNYAEDANGKKGPGPIYDVCARIVDVDSGHLEVAPCFLPSALSGAYWVNAFSDEEGWALISGGPPTISAAGGCQTGSGENGSGLWIFTRAQKRDDAVVDKVRNIAKSRGFDLSVLLAVDQTNCTDPSVSEA